jgi:DNA helicase-2/ATP-dependent DNA helicase PcrA
VRRIINVPKRGIGATSLARVSDYAAANGLTFYDALKQAEEVPSIGKGAARIKPFVTFIQTMRSKLPYMGLTDIVKEIIEETGYVAELEAEDTDEAKARIENIDELISKVAAYEENEEEPTLGGFLEEVALVADIDDLEEGNDYVVLMTLHSAKGLEFPKVFLAGMEDGLFPSYMSIMSDNATAELEEERRLAYVGITRAKEELAITAARTRLIRGETQYNTVSRFVNEIPEELLDRAPRARRGSGLVESASDLLGQSEGEEKKPAASGRTAFAGTIKPSWQQSRSKRPGMKQQPLGQNMQTKAYTKVASMGKAEIDYGVGDTVSHVKFGTGVVKSIADGGRDYEVTVDFEKYGVKKMFAAFAKLKKL